MNECQDKVCFVMGESERTKEMYKRETAAFIVYLLVCSHKREKKNRENIRERKGIERKVQWGGEMK